MAVYRFDVTASSHDLLRRGVVEARLPFSGSGEAARFHRIAVEAETQHAAELVAVEMAALVLSRYNPDVMITGAYPLF